MDWPFWILVVVVLGAWWWFKKSGLIRPEEATQLIRQGALVLDVRTPAEFQREHLGDTLNVPLGEEARRVPDLAPDRNASILVFCLSGTRSALAKSRLRRAGYRNVHNLGSLHRAEAILKQATRPPASAR